MPEPLSQWSYEYEQSLINPALSDLHSANNLDKYQNFQMSKIKEA